MLSLATLHRPHLDESVAARGGACVRIVERPGRWMSAAALDQLLTDLHTIVRAATPAGTIDYGVASGDRARLDDAILTLVYDRAGVPLAFNALTLLDCDRRTNQRDRCRCHRNLRALVCDSHGAALSLGKGRSLTIPDGATTMGTLATRARIMQSDTQHCNTSAAAPGVIG